MSIAFSVQKIDVQTNISRTASEHVAIEAPVNIFVNDEYVITLLSTPTSQQELVLGWLFTEGVLHSVDQIQRISVTPDLIRVITKHPIDERNLRVSGVSRLLTTACGLSTKKYFDIISDASWGTVTSEYRVKAENLIPMIRKLDECKLFHSTGGVHVAAIFEDERFVALAEDVGRHNTVDKVIGAGIKSMINFSRSVLISSGRQPADMVLKVARVGIPVIVSKAAPIRSGLIAAEKTGVTLICFARNHRMNVYTHNRRIMT